MSSAARKLDAPIDPVLRAAERARVGGPLSEEERLAKQEGAGEPWIDGEAVTAEIARRCADE
jgi:hypothetical protein